MLFLRGSIGPVSAISELRSTLSHSYKITTSFTSSVNSLHEQIFIVRLLSPGGAMAYVPKFGRVVVDKSCRLLPPFGVTWVKVLLNPPSYNVKVGDTFLVLMTNYSGPSLSPPLLPVPWQVPISRISTNYILTWHQGLWVYLFLQGHYLPFQNLQWRPQTNRSILVIMLSLDGVSGVIVAFS